MGNTTGKRLNKEFFLKDSFCKVNTEQYQLYEFKNETGSGEMCCYYVFDGIYMVYNDFHMKEISIDTQKYPAVIEINHCREGRIECEYGGKYLYLEEGDFVIASKDTVSKRESFPISHYHGISVIIDFESITEETFQIMRMFSISMEKLKERTCGGAKHFIMRGNDSIQHIFSELYTVHENAKLNYFKIKVIELLLFITTIDFDKNREEKQYFMRNQVKIVKKINEYLTENIDTHYTLEELAKKYNISLTVMKNCFKGIYGTSIYSYVRNLRIQKSAILLKETDLKIADIAGMVGYDNASKFSCAFKKIIGTTPLEYRKTTV